MYAQIPKRNKAIMKKIKDILIPALSTINNMPNTTKPKPL